MARRLFFMVLNALLLFAASSAALAEKDDDSGDPCVAALATLGAAIGPGDAKSAKSAAADAALAAFLKGTACLFDVMAPCPSPLPVEVRCLLSEAPSLLTSGTGLPLVDAARLVDVLSVRAGYDGPAPRQLQQQHRDAPSLSGTGKPWDYIGPLAYGKTEYDGDALQPQMNPATRDVCSNGGALGIVSGLTVNCLAQVQLIVAALRPILKRQAPACKPATIDAALSDKRLFDVASEISATGRIRGFARLRGSAFGSKWGAVLGPVQVSVDHPEVQQQARGVQNADVMEHVGWASTSVLVRGEKGKSVVIETHFERVSTAFYTLSSAPGLVHPVAGDQYGRRYTFALDVGNASATHVVTFFVRLRGQGGLGFGARLTVVGGGDGEASIVVARPLFEPDLLAPAGTFFGGPTALTKPSAHGNWLPLPVVLRGPARAEGGVNVAVRLDETDRHAHHFCVNAGCLDKQASEFAHAPKSSRADAVDVQRFDHDQAVSRAWAEEAAAWGKGHSYAGPAGLQPGQAMPLRVFVAVKEPTLALCAKKNAGEVRVTLIVSATTAEDGRAVQGSGAKVRVAFRCRDVTKDTVVFTFIDRDGTISSAAARAPLPMPKAAAKAVGDDGSPWPVVLSLHGTGVTANSQADSYKVGKAGGGYDFGVAGAWVVAPDRHGAHNWEGTGRNTALSALFAAADASRVPAVRANVFAAADANAVIYAGHSMGGHGALHLAALDPDRAVGVMLLAAWITKEHYGGANTIFRFDRSTAHVDGILRGQLEASVGDNAPDLVIGNIAHVPVMIRVGADDTTVAPYYSRRLLRLIAASGNEDVTLDEVPGQAHWWWDTKQPNDGGCMNDRTMRKFLERMVKRHFVAAKHRAAAGTATRKLATASLAHSPCSAGVCITRQERAQQLSELTILRRETTEEGGACAVHIVARNVARVRLVTAHPFIALCDRVTVVGSEGRTLHQGATSPKSQSASCTSADGGGATAACGGADGAGSSSIVLVPGALRAFPPFRVHMETAFAVDASATNNSSTTLPVVRAWLRSMATYIANAHFVAYDSFVPLLAGGQPAPARSLLHLGLTQTKTPRSGLPRPVASFSVNDREGNTEDDDAAALVDWRVAAPALKGLHHALLEVGMPTVPPMMRPPFGNILPPFATSDASRAELGFGSFETAHYTAPPSSSATE